MTRWLITGGCGFIGCNLVRHLLGAPDHAIRVLDNLAVGGREDLAALAPVREVTGQAPGNGGGSGLELVIGDVLDAEIVHSCARDRDVVVHLAASTGVAQAVADPRHDCMTNVLGTLNCLEAARHAGVARFVLASSGAPLGDVEPPIHEEKAPRPASPYGAGKLAAEAYCAAYHRSFGVETVALRFGNVYGPGSAHKSSVIATFIRRAMAGRPLEIHGDGHNTRDFVFVDDLVHAILKASRVPGIGGEVFQIATARETSVLELAELLARILEERGLDRVRSVHAPPRRGDARRSYADTSKAAALLGWQPEVALAEGLRRVVDWFLSLEPRADHGAGRGQASSVNP